MFADRGTPASRARAPAYGRHVDRIGGDSYNPPDGAAVQLRVLSGFELRVDGDVAPLPSNVERIVGYLAVHRRAQPRLTVASTLWMDTTEDRAAANLRTALWKCRQSVDNCISVHGNMLALSPSVDVDLDSAVALTHRLLDDDELRREDCDPGLLIGDLLPGWDEDWVLFERERLRQLCIHALEALCRKLSTAGQPARAIDAGLAVVAAEPLRESAQRVLIAAHLQEGNVSEARRQYLGYRDLLWREMGIEPSESLRALVGLAHANPSCG